MLITFSSDAYENITFTGDIALDMLRIMGCNNLPSGVIKAENVSSTLSQLKASLASVNSKSSNQQNVNYDDNKSISLENRAYTLIAMLEASKKMNCKVTWQYE